MSGNEIVKKETQQITKAQVSAFGDGTVFVKRTEDGFIKAVSTNITLSLEKGHIYEIQGKYSITKAGYDHMNKIAGISIITPDTITIPGTGNVMPNPYPDIDPETGSIRNVWVKKVAVGYGPTGNLIITSRTLLYNVAMYLKQDLLKKVRYNKECGKICTQKSLSDDDIRNGIYYSIEPNPEWGVWVDPNHKDILTALETYLQNKVFAERKAQTICERNAMKSHPALTQGARVHVEQGLASVKVIGWTNDFTRAELDELKSRTEAVALIQEAAETLDKNMEIDDEFTLPTEEDIMEPIDDPDAISYADPGDIPETPEAGTDSLDIIHQDFNEAHGAVAVAKVIKQNFSGKKWDDLNAIDKTAAINRLNKSLK